jgi:hypothetical protein
MTAPRRWAGPRPDTSDDLPPALMAAIQAARIPSQGSPVGTPLTPPRLCPSCQSKHPAGTTCATGWAPWTP